MMTPRRVRHDLDLTLVTPPSPGQGAPSAARGRVVAWEDGRWALHLPVRGEWVEIRGDRWSESRPLALMLLQASGLGAA
jgi:hypothetical protein